MYWDDIRNRPRQLPAYAISLLGDLRAKTAIPALIKLFYWPDMGEGLELVVSALARIGPAAVEPSKAVVLDRSLTWGPRSMAALSLVVQVYKDPEYTHELLEFLRDLLRSGPVEVPDDKIVYTLLAHNLGDLQGIEALDAVQAAFQRGVIDEFYLDWPNAEMICQNGAPHLLQRYTIDLLSDDLGQVWR
jgi:hypothetical protein